MKAKTARNLRVLLVLVLCAALWPLVAWFAAQSLIVKSEVPAADAILVFSGSSTYLERATWAAGLYRDGRAPIVIVTNDRLISGWSAAEQRNPYFYELTVKELKRNGVRAEDIHVVSDAIAGTYQESLVFREYTTSLRLKRLLVVTSAYHSRRALWSMRRAFEGTGVEIGIDGPPPGLQTPAPARWWVRRRGWRMVGGEYVKLAYYWLTY